MALFTAVLRHFENAAHWGNKPGEVQEYQQFQVRHIASYMILKGLSLHTCEAN